MQGRLEKILVALVLLLFTGIVVLGLRRNRPATASAPQPSHVTHSPDAIRTKPQVALGWQQAWLIAPDGSLWWWGDPTGGGIPPQTNRLSPTPVRVGTNTDWVTVSAQIHSAIAINRAGVLWQFDPTISPSGKPGAGATNLAPDIKWKSLGCGWQHSLAIADDGSLWAWGNNSTGELGDGTTRAVPAPIQIGTNTNWIGVGAVSSSSYGLQSDGSLWRWGMDQDGQVISGMPATPRMLLTPTRVGTNSDWIGLTMGVQSCLLTKSDGSLWSLGIEISPGAGAPQTWNLKTNPLGIGTNWTAIADGYPDRFGLKPDGTLWRFPRATTSTPSAPILRKNRWQALWGGNSSTICVALSSDGQLWTWGTVLGVPPVVHRSPGIFAIFPGGRSSWTQPPVDWEPRVLMKFLPPTNSAAPSSDK